MAIADLDGSGRPGVLVLMAGPHGASYRVSPDGDEDAAGATWSDWTPIPDWFPFENQHGGVALADLDGDGRPELIVFMIDNPAGKNRCLLRVGRKLDTGGVVTGGWSDWQEVPDWFSWENQGGGVAVVERGATRDLVVFTVTYAGPRIGVAATVGILIAGQLAMGAAIDRWGLFGSERIALHWPRLLGIALLAAGAALSLRK